MVLRDVLRQLFLGSRGDHGNRAAFRCIRCGDEFERQHPECPSCGGSFLAPTDEE